ncbi:TIGR03086 family metal-binding protein [soil metagenome]
MTDLRNDLLGALPATTRLIEAVQADQWPQTSTCQEWTVRELVDHLVGGVALTAAVLDGEDPTDRPDLSQMDNADLAAAFARAGETVTAALADPEVLQRTVRVGMGPVPGAVAAQLCLVETLVHGWDIAASTGQDVDFAEDTVQRALEFSQGMMSQIPEGRSPFAPSVEPSPDASTLDALVALLGRNPH